MKQTIETKVEDTAASARADLLAALQLAEKMLSGIYREIPLHGEWENGVGDAIETARAAIAKAKGGAE